MATTNYIELRNSIGQWGFNVTGRVMLIANSGQIAQPRAPYIALFLSEDDSLGYPKRDLSEDGLTYTVTHTARYRVQLDLYGGTPEKSATQDASLLRNSLYNPALFEDSDPEPYKHLWEICGLLNIEAVRDLSVLETGVIKQRAQLAFNVTAEMSDSFTSGFFDTAEIDIKRDEPEIDIETIVVDPSVLPPVC